MKTYSLLKFLSEPLDLSSENEDEYNFTLTGLSAKKLQTGKVISSVTIPVIQRDYAQGRKENEALRDEFVSKIFFHLENAIELRLDFIYGSLQDNGRPEFLPLDGQQRLTTLYLLHWFIIMKEVPNWSEQQSYLLGLLAKFSYETRDTSRRFFNELVKFRSADSIITDIRNAYWFNDHFKVDPTISAALNMLSTIETAYNASQKKGQLLLSLLEGIIVFFVLPMDQFRLTDDLYIKLNARGKVLSSFENLKADLIGFILKEKTFQGCTATHNGIVMPYTEIIANKFDNDWSNLFWSHVKKNYASDNAEQPEKSIDPYFFRFIHRFIVNDFIIDINEREIHNNDVYTKLTDKENSLQYSTFDFYSSNTLITADVIQRMEIILDFYLTYGLEIEQHIAPLWADSQWSIYKDSYIMNDRMLFDAVNAYILQNFQNPFDKDRFRDWIRVVWNIIADPDIRTVDANRTAMITIRDLALYSGNLNADFASGKIDGLIASLSNIHKSQLAEEKTKAMLILNVKTGSAWKDAIYGAESNKLFSGNIGFLLNGAQDADELKRRYSLARELFGAKTKPKKHALMRYVISMFTLWDELSKFNFSDSEQNWQLYLRRHNVVRPLITELCTLKSFKEIETEVLKALNRDSQLTNANSKQLRAHKTLYESDKFHQWMQSDGVNKVKWIMHHIYAVRPSAWYSKIMIDGFRNEVAEALVKKFDLEVKNRCGESSYFKGETFDLFKHTGNITVTFHFDIHNKIFIGLWGELNPSLVATKPPLNGWIQVYEFDIEKIKKDSDIFTFIENVESTIKSESDCLILDIFKH